MCRHTHNNLEIDSRILTREHLFVLFVIAQQVSKLEKKLVSMEALTPSEDALYSQAVELSGKIEWLASEIQEAIDSGKVIMCRFQSSLTLLCTMIVAARLCGYLSYVQNVWLRFSSCSRLQPALMRVHTW